MYAGTREWHVKCEDPRMPDYPMTHRDAEQQAEICDARFPSCGPHVVVKGRRAQRFKE